MTLTDLANLAFVTVLAAATVSLWTARVALAARGRTVSAAAVSAVEAVTFVAVFGQVASELGAIDRLVGYALGVAAGTLLGLWLNERFGRGQSSINLIVHGHRPALPQALHIQGWPATAHVGRGPLGPVTTVLLVVDDVCLASALDDIGQLAPDGFVTVQQLRRVKSTPLPAHFRQVNTPDKRSAVATGGSGAGPVAATHAVSRGCARRPQTLRVGA